MLDDESGVIVLLKQRYLSLLDDLRELKKIRSAIVSAVGRKDAGGAARIKRSVYILEHPRTDYSGIYGGLDFSQGRGSTSSLADRDRAVYTLGCRDISDQGPGDVHQKHAETIETVTDGR